MPTPRPEPTPYWLPPEAREEMAGRLGGEPLPDGERERFWWMVHTVVDLQTRALLAVEWQTNEFCRACGAWRLQGETHTDDCVLDAALTAVGLDTPEKRDAAREAMQGCEMCASAPGFCPRHDQAGVVAGRRVEPNP